MERIPQISTMKKKKKTFGVIVISRKRKSGRRTNVEPRMEITEEMETDANTKMAGKPERWEV